MTRRQETLRILFADITDSTYFYETLGDDRARQIVLDCLDVVSDVVTAGGGRVVDRIGDELMCIINESGELTHAHRDEFRLSGKGKIVVGTNPEAVITFQCHTKLREDQ